VVCLSACLLVITVSPMEIVELMEMLLGMKIHRATRNRALDGVRIQDAPAERGHTWLSTYSKLLTRVQNTMMRPDITITMATC